MLGLKRVSYLIVWISLFLSSFIILKDANWIIGDDYQLLGTTVKGCMSHSWIGMGRFWPLGLMDYSVLLLFFDQPDIVAHLVYNIIIMGVTVFVFWEVLNKLSFKNYFISLLCLGFIFFHSSFFLIHMNCIYPERFIFFLQSLFLYFWWKGFEKDSTIHYVLSWFFVTCSLYMKEPIFGMIGVVSSTCLIFGWNKISEKEKAFHFSVLISVCIFISLYLFVYTNMFNGVKTFYNNVVGYDNWTVFKIISAYVKQDPFIVLIILLSLVRGYCFLIKKDRNRLRIDGLLFGGIAYVCAYIILKLPYSYYAIPGVVFAVPSLTYWISYIYKKNKKQSHYLLCCCLISFVPSVEHQIDQVNEMYEHRQKDIIFVDKIVDAYLVNKKPYFFVGKDPIEMFTQDNKSPKTYFFRLCMTFLNYRLRIRKGYEDDHMFVIENNLNKVPENSYLFISRALEKKYSDFLKTNFAKLKSFWCINIYKRSN